MKLHKKGNNHSFIIYINVSCRKQTWQNMKLHKKGKVAFVLVFLTLPSAAAQRRVGAKSKPRVLLKSSVKHSNQEKSLIHQVYNRNKTISLEFGIWIRWYESLCTRVSLNSNLIQLKSFSMQTELLTHFELVSVALTSYLNLLLKNSNNFLSDLRYCEKIGIYSRYVHL